jgi:hypothetical protein
MNTITQIINVTAKHIAEGDAESSTTCPIALAISEQVIGNPHPYVLCDSIAFGGLGWETEIPEEMQNFIRDFDAGLPVEPIAFPLDIPVDE